jgi:cell division inhibitor SepF
MATKWRRAMHYLGLGPDDEYDDDQGYAYEDPSSASSGASAGTPAVAMPGRPAPPSGVSRVDPRPAPPRQGSEHGVTVRPAAAPAEPSQVRPITPAATSRDVGARTSGSVRQIPASPRPHLVAPVAFNDAQEVGDHFKAGQPVVMDLAGVDRELARRLIDFCSGMCYGLGGQMERIASHSYLVVPDGVEVSDDERRRLAGNGS